MIKGLAVAFISFIILMAVGYYITTNIADHLESQDDLEQETIDTINRLKENYIDANEGVIAIFVFFIVPALIILIIVGRYNNSGMSYSDTTIFGSDKKLEKYNDAVTILKRRYAMGEINSFEYTEKMSRL